MKQQMTITRSFPALLLVFLVLLFGGCSNSGGIHVATASNFADTMLALVKEFQARGGPVVLPVDPNAGKHYAQIKNGAPFDCFLAADTRRPRLLEEEGIAVPGSRFTYAEGKLVLWSARSGYIDPEGLILLQGDFRHLAITNPRLAPYGQAAKEVLQNLGILDRMREKLVQGENISQTFQFVRSGNAELGLVALSQADGPAVSSPEGSHWVVPQNLYTPIRQQAVLLRDRKPARDFLDFVRSRAGREIIRRFGYDTP